MSPPRFLADEMVGRLARLLRVVGCDTVYARGVTDSEILDLARAEDRTILTRDRQLAHRAPKALLIESPDVAEQWSSLVRAYPEVPRAPAFDRCTECNGRLAPYAPGPADPRRDGVPWDRVAKGLALYRCASCDHLYWEGSHTERIRRQLERWSADGAA